VVGSFFGSLLLGAVACGVQTRLSLFAKSWGDADGITETFR
jgi:hypothetical protein